MQVVGNSSFQRGHLGFNGFWSLFNGDLVSQSWSFKPGRWAAGLSAGADESVSSRGGVYRLLRTYSVLSCDARLQIWPSPITMRMEEYQRITKFQPFSMWSVNVALFVESCFCIVLIVERYFSFCRCFSWNQIWCVLKIRKCGSNRPGVPWAWLWHRLEPDKSACQLIML